MPRIFDNINQQLPPDLQEAIKKILPCRFLRGSDDEFEEGIQHQQQDRTEHFARYFIVPWNLTCILRQHKELVYVDMYLGEQAWDLITLRIV